MKIIRLYGYRWTEFGQGRAGYVREWAPGVYTVIEVQLAYGDLNFGAARCRVDGTCLKFRGSKRLFRKFWEQAGHGALAKLALKNANQ